MTEEQPQLFTIPATTLSTVVNFLGELPFKQVANVIMMIDQTVKVAENGTVQRSKSKRTRSRSQPQREG